MTLHQALRRLAFYLDWNLYEAAARRAALEYAANPITAIRDEDTRRCWGCVRQTTKRPPICALCKKELTTREMTT
jgi:hypothetical protein